MNMKTANYTNQFFKEKFEISEGSPIFENCIFEKGVEIKGNKKRYFTKGDETSPIFKSCTFRSQMSEPSVVLWEGAHGEFHDCSMSTEKYVSVRIDIGSHAVFRNCSISASHPCAVAIMIGSSGDFENCRFSIQENIERSIPLEPVYFDANNKEKTRFSNCSFNKGQ